MVKRLMLIALLGIAMAVIFQAESEAGCIDLGGGDLYCAEWIPGSEICKLNTTGGVSSGNSSARCEVDPPSASGEITGTLVCKQTSGRDITAAKGSANQQGKCKDHQFNGPGVGHGHHEDDCIVLTATLDAGDVGGFPLFSETGPGGLRCNARGKCQTSLEVDIPQEEGDEICNRLAGGGAGSLARHSEGASLEFVTFTANEFLGTSRICPGGSFYYNGSCSSEGGATERGRGSSELVIEQLCKLSKNGKSYDCKCVSEGCFD